MSYGGGDGGGGGGDEILQKNQGPTTAANMRLAFCADGTAVYKPIMTHDTTFQQQQQQERQVVSAIMGVGIGGVGVDVVDVAGFNINAEPMKRKRGRPRKYSPPEGSLTSPNHHTLQSPNPAEFQPPSQPMAKKARGRPPGSGRNAQLPAIGMAGVGFMPHVITVKTGEDVLSKIMSFSQNGTRAVCILSANGAISNVTLRQPATSGGAVTYEGRFEILSLSGSFLLSESDGQRSRMGGLSVSLAGPDGRIVGGGVAGPLIAASSVQVIVGSFAAQDRKELKIDGQPEILSVPPKLVQRASASGSSPSRGTLSESSGGPGSPPNQSTGPFNNTNPLGMPNMTWI